MVYQAPIKTALVGLSASATTAWASTAHLPGFLTPEGVQLFKIVALLNSSTSAAEAAIKAYRLPSDVKALGSVEELEADNDIDLVIINTRVDKHFESAKAAILSGKDVYVEWPIGKNQSEIQELLKLKAANNVAVAVGLQGRWAPPVAKLRGLLEHHTVGRLVSSQVQAFGGTKDRSVLPEGLKYFAELSVGGNPVTIGFGHVIDFVQSVVGEIEQASTAVRMQVQRPNVPVRKSEGSVIVATIDSDVPDLVMLHGSLTASSHVVPNASLSFYFRRGQPFPGDPALRWSLNCERGELLLTAPSGISLQADACDERVRIQVHDFASDKVSEVDWTWDDKQKQIPVRARGVQRCLYAFAKGDRSTYVSLESAAVRATQIEDWIKMTVMQ